MAEKTRLTTSAGTSHAATSEGKRAARPASTISSVISMSGLSRGGRDAINSSVSDPLRVGHPSAQKRRLVCVTYNCGAA